MNYFNMRSIAFIFLFFLFQNLHPQWSQVAFDEQAVFTIYEHDDHLYSGWNNYIYRSPDGVMWDSISTLQNLEVFCFSNIADTLFACIQHGITEFTPEIACIFKSIDQGFSWDSSYAGIFGTSTLINVNNNLFADVDSKLYRSNDRGSSWHIIQIDTLTNYGLHQTFAANIFCDDSDIYVVLTDLQGLYKSDDLGMSWIKISSNLPNQNILYFESIDSTIFVSLLNEGVFKSYDNGDTWEQLNSGFPDGKYAHYIKYLDHHLWAVIDNQIYLMDLEQKEWVNISDGLNLNSWSWIHKILVHENFIYAGTSDGIWRRAVSEITYLESTPIDNQPVNSTIVNCYPNPFNNLVTIEIAIKIRENVTIEIFSIDGRKISTIYSGNLSEGTYSYTWDALNQSSGLYFYSIESPTLRETGKLIYIK